MELIAYLRILARKWRILLVVYAVTFLSTVIWTARQPWIYETTATFVIRPRAELTANDDFVRTLDIVSRRAEINSTFAEVANSRSIRSAAIARMQLSPEQVEGLSVSARVIGGTNVLELVVQGYDPVITRDFANAVGAETMQYTSNLYDIFNIEPLDMASLPLKPIRPNVLFNLVLGAFIGLILGLGVTFSLRFFETAEGSGVEYFNIIDRETGAFNKSYFLLRLEQEMARAKRNKYPLSVGLVKIDVKTDGTQEPIYGQDEVLRRARVLAGKSLRQEDVLARLNNATYAVMMPDVHGENAKKLLGNFLADVRAIAYDINHDEANLFLKCSAGIVAYDIYRNTREQLLKKAVKALQDAEGVTEEEVVLFANNHRRGHVTRINAPAEKE